MFPLLDLNTTYRPKTVSLWAIFYTFSIKKKQFPAPIFADSLPPIPPPLSLLPAPSTPASAPSTPAPRPLYPAPAPLSLYPAPCPSPRSLSSFCYSVLRVLLLVYFTSNGTQFFGFKILHEGFFILKICMRIDIAKP